MELEDMKTVWEDMSRKKDVPQSYQIDDVSPLKRKKKMNLFKSSEITGLLVAYSLGGIVLYKFKALDTLSLQLCGIFLILYFFTMPFFSLSWIWKMKNADLTHSDYKHLLVHFYSARTRIKKAEKISFIASPFLFVASMAVFTKLLKGLNLFALKFPWPVYIFMVFTLLAATIFNLWAFRKREIQLKSLEQLLLEGY